MAKNPHACDDCNLAVEADDFHMVILGYYDWQILSNGDNLLCCGCIEKRLGRELRFGDFPDKDVAIYDTWQIGNLRSIPVNKIYFKHRGWI